MVMVYMQMYLKIVKMLVVDLEGAEPAYDPKHVHISVNNAISGQ